MTQNKTNRKAKITTKVQTNEKRNKRQQRKTKE